ncbi:MAG: ABC transporter permease subunit [Actinobacteria bacterium]|nr:ABC transporter permease subunit [Actinomycetota bacterium]
MRRPSGLGNNLFVLPALLFIVFIMIYPLGYNFYLSFRDVTIGNYLAGDAPFVGLKNYIELVKQPAFIHALVVSALFTSGSLVFQFSIGFALAVFFSRPFPGSGIMRAFIMLGWMIPLVVSANVWRWMLAGDYSVINVALRGLGLIQESPYWLSQPSTALLGVVTANIWVGVPFNMVLLLAGLQGIPKVLYEAAKVDGCGPWQQFWHITLPQIRPVALVTLLLGFIYTFKVFDLIFVMTSGGPVNATTVLPIHVYKLTFDFLRFSDGAAAASMLLLISLCLTAGYLWLIRREETA